MKKTNKFLLLALILIGATNQISLSMQKEEVIEIKEKEQEKVLIEEVVEKQPGNSNIVTKEENDRLKELSLEKEDQAEERVKKLGDLSVLPNEILFIICEFADVKSLLNLSKNSILREIIFTTSTKKDIVKIHKKIEQIRRNPINHPKLIIIHGQNTTSTLHAAGILCHQAFEVNYSNCKIIETGKTIQSNVGGKTANDNLLDLFNKIKKSKKKIGVIIITSGENLFRKKILSDDFRHFGNIIDKELIDSMKKILKNNSYKNIILILTTENINDIPNEIKSESILPAIEMNYELANGINGTFEPLKNIKKK